MVKFIREFFADMDCTDGADVVMVGFFALFSPVILPSMMVVWCVGWVVLKVVQRCR